MCESIVGELCFLTCRAVPRAILHRISPICLVTVGIFASVSAYGDSTPADQALVKAAFLFNFAKFVEWPANSSKPLAFCVIGDDRMAAYLQAGIAGKSIESRSLTVRNRPDLTQLDLCSVIYIGPTEKKVVTQVAQLVAGKQILTVSEFSELGSQGAVISFFLDDERVRFEVNLGAVRQAGVKLSSKLLALARIVGQ